MKNYFPLTKWFILFLITAFLSCQKESKQVIHLDKLNPDKLRYRFKTAALILNDNKRPYESIDLNMDGQSEIIQIDNMGLDNDDPTFIQILESPFEKIIARKNFKGLLSLSGITDYDQDKIHEIYISEQINDTLYINILTLKGRNIIIQHRFAGAMKSETKNVVQKWPWHCVLIVEGILDINNDNYLDILFRIDTNNAYQPRGFLAYDIHNKKEIWRKITGYQPIHVNIFNKQDRSNDLIISGSSSPGNAGDYLVNGTNDLITYFIILKKDGTCYHKEEIGEKTTLVKPYIQDLNDDGKKEVLFSFSTFGNQKLENYIRFFDIDRMRMTSRRYGRECRISSNIGFIDGDRDGDTDILMGWEDGTIEIRDYGLNRVQSIAFPRFLPGRLFIEDLNRDGTKEILCSGHYKGEPYVLLLSATLKLQGLMPGSVLVDGNIIYETKFGGEKWIRLIKEEYLQYVKLVSNNPFRVFINQFGFFHGFMIMLVLAVMVGALIYQVQEKQKKSQLLKSTVDTYHIPAIMVNVSGLVRAVNLLFRQLVNLSLMKGVENHWEYLLIGQTWAEIRKWLKEAMEKSHHKQQKEFSILIENEQRDLLISVYDNPIRFHKDNFKLITFQDITEIAQSKRAVAWASMAQRLAHEIKTPLSTLMLTTQRLQMEMDGQKDDFKETDRYTKRILNQVRRLRKMTDAFLKFCRIEKPHLERISINELIRKVLTENRSRIGKKVTIETSLPKVLPRISIDTNQISIVLQNLIDNSLNAMSGKGILNISTRLVQWLLNTKSNNHREAIQIEISDTGKGMTPEELNRLFKPFFSNSPGGTGLGLVIVKKIIEDHYGEIKYKSEPNIGTTVLITLPVNHSLQ